MHSSSQPPFRSTLLSSLPAIYVQTKNEPLEDVVRRVVKDELRKGRSKRASKPTRAA